jgi:hypothetical protein
MKFKILSVLAAASAILTFTIGSLDAIGGGRGGGGGGGGGGVRGGGGGAYRGGQTINRTPTMTRPAVSTRPQVQHVQQARPQIQARPQVRQPIQTQQREQLRNQAKQYAQKAAIKTNPQTLSQHQQTFATQRLSQVNNNRQFSSNVSKRLSGSRTGYHQWFNNDFYHRHNLNPAYGIDNKMNWWRAGNWAALSSWGDWGWSSPYYYDDGGYPLSVPDYQGDSYAQGYSNPAEVAQGSGDWMPIGVFAVGRNASEAAVSNRFVQLALNRNGEIDGVYYNALSDSAQDISGSVDAGSQQAYWSLSNVENSPIATTGLYNLTEPVTSVRVLFSDGSTQVWSFVRLQNGQG